MPVPMSMSIPVSMSGVHIHVAHVLVHVQVHALVHVQVQNLPTMSLNINLQQYSTPTYTLEGSIVSREREGRVIQDQMVQRIAALNSDN